MGAVVYDFFKAQRALRPAPVHKTALQRLGARGVIKTQLELAACEPSVVPKETA
jgi:hypothetical protein